MDSAAETVERIAAIGKRDRRLIASFRGEEASAEAGPQKIRALLDATRALDAASISQALIGGIAVGIHAATPRATLDVNLAADSAAKIDRIADVLVAAGFRKTGSFPHSVNFRHASGEPLQVAIDASFDPMIERAEHFDLAGSRIRIVRRDDLIEMKQRAAADPARRKSKRLRDQADVELLRGDVPDPDERW